MLLTAAGDRVLRFSPPLIVSIEELEEGVRAVRLACEELAAGSRGSTAAAAAKRFALVAVRGPGSGALRMAEVTAESPPGSRPAALAPAAPSR